MVTTRLSAWQVAASVPDPELPVVTVADLGILRAVDVDGEAVVVTITPTYTGCPALLEIGRDLERRLQDAGFGDVSVRVGLSPAWSSDWITPEGRQKLDAAGIAPPQPARVHPGPTPLSLTPRPRQLSCPRCGSPGAVSVSEFSATACKALYRCPSCAEPFEYVKEI